MIESIKTASWVGFHPMRISCYCPSMRQNPGVQVLQICLIHLMLVSHRPVFCLPYVSLATQQFQAWTPNESKHDSRTDLRFRCCLPLGVSSESSKYINFLSDCLNFHEPRSGDDANIRSFWFSNSSLKQISSNSVYIFLRILPHLWERTNDRQWNWCEQYAACVCPSLAAGSLWFLAQFRLRMDPGGLSNRGVAWLGNLVRYQMYLSTVCLQILFFCDPAAIVSRELKVHVSLLALRSRCLDDYLSWKRMTEIMGRLFSMLA